MRVVSLSLGQFTAIDVGPVEYISIAADAGFQKVSLLVNSPNPKSEYPLVTRENSSEVKTALQTSGLGVNNIECFMLTPTTDIDRF